MNAPLQSWSVPSSTSSGHHTVTERIDSVKGGTYLHCTCKGWAFAFNRGTDCRHVAGIRGKGGHHIADPATRTSKPEDHQYGPCADLAGPHSAEDHAAAVLLGAWTR